MSTRRGCALPPQVNGFQLLKFLGKGTFGAVYEARREIDGQRYAIKKVDTRKMTNKDRAEAVNEIRVLASIGGDHVITFYEAFVDADILYIVRAPIATGGRPRPQPRAPPPRPCARFGCGGGCWGWRWRWDAASTRAAWARAVAVAAPCCPCP